MDARFWLLSALAVGALAFSVFWARALRAQKQAGAGRLRPNPLEAAIGFVTDFLDTLGVGSFATTTAIFRALRIVRDQHLPGTLNVGHTMPTFAQALIYIAIVEVDAATLALLIAAATVGALLGAGAVAKWPVQRVRAGMGMALLAAAALIVARQLGLMPLGGQDKGLAGSPLALGLAGNFVLGAMMTIGVGLYAPCMVLVSLLGMDPRAAFPIMMGSCAFLMLAAGTRFVSRQSYSAKAALGLTLGGIPGVLLAASLVRELPLAAVRWLVLAVVLYTALTLLRDARREPRRPGAAGPPEPA